mgnify:CR=1 FL=1
MLYLASASPRRRDLLKLAGFRFTVEPAEIDEVIAQDDPACLVQNLALKKARAVAKLHPDDVVLATIFLENPRMRNKHKKCCVCCPIEFTKYIPVIAS